jgi:hypothetical protein
VSRPEQALHLTKAQTAFARAHGATAIRHAEVRADAVFVYQETATHTRRWLVAVDGEVLESAAFRTLEGREPGEPGSDESSLDRPVDP